MTTDTKTANQTYVDRALRHQVQVRRYSAAEVNDMLALIEASDAELAVQLRAHLANLAGRPFDAKAKRFQQMMADLADLRFSLLGKLRSQAIDNLKEFAKVEAASEAQTLAESIPFEVSFTQPAVSLLNAVVTSQPFHGHLLSQWFEALGRNDRGRIVQALQIGLTTGQTLDDIVRRIIGTRALNYTDGVTAINRRDATAIMRTAINHVSNAARNEVWEANSDVIDARVWVSTLDGRTTLMCISRDGHGTSMRPDGTLPDGIPPLDPPEAVPPGHINCRSTMVAYIDGVSLLGTRPAVGDSRTPRGREADFRAMAAATGKPIKQIRKEWADKYIGQVPARMNYEEWLKGQSVTFQNDVLGADRAELFRAGKLSVSEFVDHSGKTLTLEQLKATHPEAFQFGPAPAPEPPVPEPEPIEPGPNEELSKLDDGGYEKLTEEDYAMKRTLDAWDFKGRSPDELALITSMHDFEHFAERSLSEYADFAETSEGTDEVLRGVREYLNSMVEVNERFGLPKLKSIEPFVPKPGGRIPNAAFNRSRDVMLVTKHTFKTEAMAVKKAALMNQFNLTPSEVDALKLPSDIKIRAYAWATQQRGWGITINSAETAYHEMGHRLEGSPKMMAELDKAKAKAFASDYKRLMSQYAETNEHELVAESFALYMKGNRNDYWRIHPDLLQVFQKYDRYHE